MCWTAVRATTSSFKIEAPIGHSVGIGVLSDVAKLLATQ